MVLRLDAPMVISVIDVQMGVNNMCQPCREAGALLGKMQAPCHPVMMDVTVKGLLCCFSPNGQDYIMAEM